METDGHAPLPGHRVRLVDGVEVIQELQTGSALGGGGSPASASSASAAAPASYTTHHHYHQQQLAPSGLKTAAAAGSSPPLGLNMTDYSPPAGHADVVADLTLVQASTQTYLVSASKDGVVKVWK